MSQFPMGIVSYALNSLWQIPALLAAGWLLARIMRPAGPRVEHRIWVGILFFQILLPAFFLVPWEWFHAFPFPFRHPGTAAHSQVSVALGPGTVAAGLPVPFPLLVSILVAYLAVTAWFGARLLWRSRTLATLRRESVAVALLQETEEVCAHCSRIFSIAGVSLATSTRVSGPVTMGVRRKLILLPASMAGSLSNDDLRTVIAHEYAHMRRCDFLKNLFYEWLSLPIAYHPLLWLTRSRIMQSREMICDEMAAEVSGRANYARSLLRLARMLLEGAPAITPHTIGIFDAGIFERRIMNLTHRHTRLGTLKQASLLVAGAFLMFGVSTLVLAVAGRIQPVAASDNGPSQANKQLTVSADVMSQQIVTKAVPVYPPDAKKAKVQGKVVLDIVIDKGGNVQNATAISGPPELRQSAIDAVRQWKYKPYLLNGDPVEVLSTVNIIYSLAG